MDKMSLGEKQRLFVRLLPRLIDHVYSKGYMYSLGEGKRTAEQAELNAMGVAGRLPLVDFLKTNYPVLAEKIFKNKGKGIRGTLHELGLAIDFNLFNSEGFYLESTEAHRFAGEFWEGLHPLCRWGGRFGDGNHYSLEHDGKK